MGIEFQVKRVELDGKKLKLQLWDTAGQEKFRAITPSYFRGSQGILLCFDVTCRSSFDTLKRWFEVRRALQGEGGGGGAFSSAAAPPPRPRPSPGSPPRPPPPHPRRRTSARTRRRAST